MNDTSVRLTIVIPALNEEDAIGATIERCLAAREEIEEATGVAEVVLVVVSDGSTDRTAQIASGYSGVQLVVFPENQGYGAAIKAGWEHAPGDLLAFLDADGTCDPLSFVPMCQRVLDEGYDLVLGARMGADSRMPLMRRAGNLAFALLLGHLSQKAVRDTASGMRVLRREALPRLLPLPDGLHFTPAMSAHALMDDELRLAEIDMPYRERVGHSKLSVLRDGIRFLGVILDTAAYLRLSRITIPLILGLAVLAAVVLAVPSLYYLRHARLEEWMFYRFTLSGTVGTVAVVVLCATIVCEHISALTLLRYERFSPLTRGLWRYENLQGLLILAALLGIVGGWLNWGGVVQFFTTGRVTLHWSRVMVGAFFGINLTLLLATVATIRIVRSLYQRQPYLRRLDDSEKARVFATPDDALVEETNARKALLARQ